MLGGALRFVRSNPVATLVPALVAVFVLAVAQVLLQVSLVSDIGSDSDFSGLTSGTILLYVVVIVLAVVLFPPVLAIHHSVLVPAIVGRQLTLGQAWAAARPHLGRVYGVQLTIGAAGLVVFAVAAGIGYLLGSLLGGVGVAIGVLIFIAVYVGWIYVVVLVGPAAPVAVVEGAGVRPAFERARELVTGSWWRFFGIQLLGGLIVGVVAMVVMIPVSILATVVAVSSFDTSPSLPVGYFVIIGIGILIVGTLALPYIVGMTGLLYVDQRIRRERFDLQLASLAQNGQPGPGQPGPPPGYGGPAGYGG